MNKSGRSLRPHEMARGGAYLHPDYPPGLPALPLPDSDINSSSSLLLHASWCEAGLEGGSWDEHEIGPIELAAVPNCTYTGSTVRLAFTGQVFYFYLPPPNLGPIEAGHWPGARHCKGWCHKPFLRNPP